MILYGCCMSYEFMFQHIICVLAIIFGEGRDGEYQILLFIIQLNQPTYNHKQLHVIAASSIWLAQI